MPMPELYFIGSKYCPHSFCFCLLIAVSENGVSGIVIGGFVCMFCFGPIGIFLVIQARESCKKKGCAQFSSTPASRTTSVRTTTQQTRAAEESDEETTTFGYPRPVPPPVLPKLDPIIEGAPPHYRDVCSFEPPVPRHAAMIRVQDSPTHACSYNTIICLT